MPKMKGFFNSHNDKVTNPKIIIEEKPATACLKKNALFTKTALRTT